MTIWDLPDTLLERLRKQMLDTYFHGLSDQIKGMTPETLAARRAAIATIEKHVSSAIAKLGVTSRTGIARLVERQGTGLGT